MLFSRLLFAPVLISICVLGAQAEEKKKKKKSRSNVSIMGRDVQADSAAPRTAGNNETKKPKKHRSGISRMGKDERSSATSLSAASASQTTASLDTVAKSPPNMPAPPSGTIIVNENTPSTPSTPTPPGPEPRPFSVPPKKGAK